MPLAGHLQKLSTVNHLGLPRLPVPALSDTLQRYLLSVQPIADAPHFETLQRAAADFESGIGKTLHESLLRREATRAEAGGYPYFHFEEAWDAGYLEARCPNPVNINPFYVLNHPDPTDTDPVTNAAKIVHASMVWLGRARAGTLPSDGGDASQTALFLGTARVPKEGRDVLEHHGSTSAHVVVQCRGAFYRVDTLDAAGEPLPYEQLCATFRAIYAEAEEAPAVGALTGGDRNVWAATRARLAGLHADNAQSLKEIDEALLMVSLDVGSAARDAGLTGRCRSMLHGPAVPGRSAGNRWFDKHQLIADEGGALGFNFEHSFSDGGSWNKVFGEIYEEIAGHGERYAGGAAAGAAAASSLRRLPFQLDDGLLADVAAAEVKLRDDCVKGVELSVLDFDDFGKKEIKTWGVSPDAALQLCFQASYRQLHGKAAPTYEACAMRGFFRGRTETIRSCIPPADHFARVFNTPSASKEEVTAALRAAVAAQSQQAKLAASGEGVDRHLLSLKEEAVAAGVSLDSVPLFADPVLKQSGDWILSTSNVTAPFIKVFGFGAVTTHGYGLGYMTFNENLPICITSFTAGDTCAGAMREAISGNLKKIQDLF
eukprot:Rhum_TRINITY_DN14479_c19_g1::Rhum_TRINITY_DN14479_c19_g1_i1::g.91985::m.91985/K08766/CPT2; carnitine O-palmitoyltransferase 2